MGVDFGSKRIGLALGVDEPEVVTPRPSISPTGTLAKDAAALAEIAAREQVDAIVVGIPENADDGRMARICRTLAGHIREFGYVVHEVDESLTSVEAEDALRSANIRAALRRRLKDGEAACRIIERYFGETKAR
jgi:putative Holliday junction resolvase